ncbi:MAG: PSD1 and planctomycete cytochrome C domain-containing protein [Fuerstiella sp.]
MLEISRSAVVIPLMLAALLVHPTPLFGQQNDGSGVSFNQDIRPLLSDNCFKCHGPDENDRQADLRLDQSDAVDFQQVMDRITSNDPDTVMPPPDSNKKLDSTEIQTLKTWIHSGAQYEAHWAFVPPQAATIPSEQNTIDYFVNRALRSNNMTPATAADFLILLRRASLDLVGLPPTIEQTQRISANPSDATYLAIIDELLQSPQYGERWARKWLDLARYADTNGYEKDRDRSVWPYRDWVIQAINSDMPFDQFTIEQIAGDMLPHPTASQIVATGFHRNTMLNEEGGIDPLEFRFHAMTDRVATTGTTWLGLTTGCAQCHTHKYDPITHVDYFGMMAFLNNADEPDFHVPPPQDKPSKQATATKLQTLLDKLPSQWPKQNEKYKGPTLEQAIAKWIKIQRQPEPTWTVIEPSSMLANYPFLVQETDGIIFAGGDTSKHDVYTLKFAATERPIRSLRLETFSDPRLPGQGPGKTYYEGRKGDFFLTELQVETSDGTPITFQSASESYSRNGFGSAPATAAQSIDSDIETGWGISAGDGIQPVAVFHLKDPIPPGKSFTIRMHFGRHYAASLGKFRISFTSQTGAPHASDLTEAQRMAINAADAVHDPKVRQLFCMHAKELEKQSRAIHRLKNYPAGTPTLVMRERPSDQPRITRRHHRGEYTQPKETVQPRLPDAILPANDKPPTNRLEFAQWLVSEQNPLTARVVVNRHWAAFFGTGIVSTLDDFGMQSAPPSHPELLDTLAVQFMNNGWSIKNLHRTIVTSDTYRRSSTSDLAGSQNARRLLQHFPRTRLEAEIIRDSALAASGLLASKMYGPPVRPPQPDSASANYSKSKWVASKGIDRYRRSVYTYQKRTAPFAMFTTFDASSGEACVARRDVSNTPLQALTLMNDPMFIEIAEALGERMKGVDGDVDQQLETGFRWLLTRTPLPDEISLLSEFHRRHNNWTATARALLSLDEAITKN